MPPPVCPSRSGQDGTPNSSAAGFMSIPAGQHAKRLLQAVHTLTESGRSYGAVARELGLDRSPCRVSGVGRRPRQFVRPPDKTDGSRERRGPGSCEGQVREDGVVTQASQKGETGHTLRGAA